MRSSPACRSNPPDAPPAAGKLDEFIAASTRRGGKTYDPNALSAEQKTKLTQALIDTFGSPAAPLVRTDDDRMIEHLRLQTRPSRRRQQALPEALPACHGLTGDGRGSDGAMGLSLPA